MLYSSLGDDRSRARCLVALAGVAVEDGSAEVAARLLGAAEAARGLEAPDEFELPILERSRAAFDRLGAESVERLQREGRLADPGTLVGALVTKGTAA
jgi:hypothetical protein